MTGAFPGFSLGVLVMGQGPVEARGKRAVFSKARWARLCGPRRRQLPPGVSVCDFRPPSGSPPSTKGSAR